MFRPCSKSVQIMKHSIGSGRIRFSSIHITPYDSTINNANKKNGWRNTKIIMSNIIDAKQMLVICGTVFGGFGGLGYFVYTQLEKLNTNNKDFITELKNDNKAFVKEMKDDNKAFIKDLKDDNKALVKEIKDDNKVILKEMKDDNKAMIKEIKDDNKEGGKRWFR